MSKKLLLGRELNAEMCRAFTVNQKQKLLTHSLEYHWFHVYYDHQFRITLTKSLLQYFYISLSIQINSPQYQ